MNTSVKKFSLGTFSFSGSPDFPALVIDDKVVALSALKQLLRNNNLTLVNASSVLNLLDAWEYNFEVLKKVVAALSDGSSDSNAVIEQMVSVETLDVLPPVNLPRQVFCAGANYFKHVVDYIVSRGPGIRPGTDGMNPEELRAHAVGLMEERGRSGDPYIWTKPVSAICGANDPIKILDVAIQPDWELEMAVVIGKPAFQLTQENAMEYVAGYTIGNDISNRGQIFRTDDMKGLGSDWLSSKSSPGYLPLGPYFVPAEFVENHKDLQINLALNGEMKQDESTDDMIFGIPRLLEYLTERVKLFPGDILCTGSPAGNGVHYKRFLQPGDVMDASITGLGKQKNHII
jgi:2,4-diketo-3-deoxy-L-fuconate hydrolase